MTDSTAVAPRKQRHGVHVEMPTRHYISDRSVNYVVVRTTKTEIRAFFGSWLSPPTGDPKGFDER